LVTAASNTAVDLLTEKLAAKGLRVLRLGNPARIDADLHTYSIDEQVAKHPQFKDLKKMRKDAESYKQLAMKYKRSFGAGEREQRKLLLQEAKNILKEADKTESYIHEGLLQQTQVITATLTGTSSYLLANKVFSTVFIDEAAQALEPACWIAIGKAQRVVMAGDHCQLPPTVKSIEADKQGLSKTLFEKAKEKQEKLGVKIDTMLEVQYRMHKQIMEFSNQEFYKGKLQAADMVADRKLDTAPTNPYLFQPLEWIDTAGCGFTEQKDEETNSLYNAEEAQLVVKHLTNLIDNLHINYLPENIANLTIGVISPYKSQVKLLNELLANFPPAPMVVANTVDGFQGQERNIIYISLVRSNENGEIGFLKDLRRMNVAMTRAKQKLVIVGDSATLSNHAFYQKLLDYADQIQGYKTAWEFMA
jgi:ATP-dependent RNA/DNA helicase IGHMBP2